MAEGWHCGLDSLILVSASSPGEQLRRRTLVIERNILVSSKLASRKGSLSSLGKGKPRSYEAALMEMVTAGHVGAGYVPVILMIVVNVKTLFPQALASRPQ